MWKSRELALWWTLRGYDAALTLSILASLLPLLVVRSTHCLQQQPRVTSQSLSLWRARCKDIPTTYCVGVSWGPTDSWYPETQVVDHLSTAYTAISPCGCLHLSIPSLPNPFSTQSFLLNLLTYRHSKGLLPVEFPQHNSHIPPAPHDLPTATPDDHIHKKQRFHIWKGFH